MNGLSIHSENDTPVSRFDNVSKHGEIIESCCCFDYYWNGIGVSVFYRKPEHSASSGFCTPVPSDLDAYFEEKCRERIELFLASEGI